MAKGIGSVGPISQKIGDKLGQQYIVHGGLVGGLDLDSNGKLVGLAGVGAGTPNLAAAGRGASAESGSLDSEYFMEASGSIVHAFNHLAKSGSINFRENKASAASNATAISSNGSSISTNSSNISTNSTNISTNATGLSTLSGRSLTAGVGLSGGGDLSTNRSFALDLSELTEKASNPVAADEVAIIDSADSDASKRMTVSNFVGLLDGAGLTATNGVLAVDAAQTQITSVGTIAAGTWTATDVAVLHGGTGASNASDARTNLGVAIGSDVQAYDAQLADVAGLTPADGKFIVGDGSNFVVEDGATARASLGLTIGTHVQAYDAQLADVAGLTPSDSGFIVGDGSNFVVETSVAALASLGLTAVAAELNLLDSGAGSSVALAGGDGVIMFDASDSNDPKKVLMSDVLTFVQSGISLGAAQIAADAIGASEIVALGVGTAELQNAAITGAKFDPVIDHSTSGDYLVLEAGQAGTGGLMLKGKDADGASKTYRVEVDGGVLQLVEDATSLSATGATGAAGS
jgi:hypothetical protein